MATAMKGQRTWTPATQGAGRLRHTCGGGDAQEHTLPTGSAIARAIDVVVLRDRAGRYEASQTSPCPPLAAALTPTFYPTGPRRSCRLHIHAAPGSPYA